jgi:hypothetical protein
VTAAREEAVRLVREGQELHHGASDDPDLALLDGDRLYAEGLAALADDGDLEGVRILAEVIAASAAALGAGDAEAAGAAWEQGLRALSDSGGTA